MILRALALLLVVTAAAQAQPQRPSPAADTGFQKFVAELWKDAQAKGITRQTFNTAFAGVTPDPRVVSLTTRQPEQAKPMGAYVASLASPQRAAMGVRKEAEWRGLFEAVEEYDRGRCRSRPRCNLDRELRQRETTQHPQAE